MRLSRAALDAYNRSIKAAGNGAENAARNALAAWMRANPDASIEDTRKYCIGLMRELGTTYGQAAGDAAYALRDLTAEAYGVDVASVDYAYEPEMQYVEKTARYQVKKLMDGRPDEFVDQIADASRYFAERGANTTMHVLTRHDEAKLGRKVRFARVPTGPTTCGWCLMLASRGFVYYTAERAGEANKYHRHCDCRIIPGYGDSPQVEGYDPDDLYQQWRDSEFKPKSSGSKSKPSATEPNDKKSAVPKAVELIAQIDKAADMNEVERLMTVAKDGAPQYSAAEKQGIQWAFGRARNRFDER